MVRPRRPLYPPEPWSPPGDPTSRGTALNDVAPGDGRPEGPASPPPPSPLFAWSGGGIVLLGERRADRWVVARGWRDGDRLSDVRRWSFAEPRAFAGQVRRLVRDATADRTVGSSVAAEALAWAGDGPPPA